MSLRSAAAPPERIRVVATTEQRRRDRSQARERLDTFLMRSGLERRAVTLVPLTGDASDRRYYRVVLRDAPSLVLALHPEPFEYEALPFVRVASLFRTMALPVPDIIGHAEDLGVLVLQDLGDVTLQAYLGAVQPVQHEGLYRQAVAFLEILQRRGAELASIDHPAYRIAFDVEKLTWELDFFTKHFIEGFRGTRMSAAQHAALAEEWRSLAEDLASEPRVLCHRDYHSRNLMLNAGDLYIIDFQDARLGPDTYDLVSLLRDSYVDLPEERVDQLVAHFVALKREGMPNELPASWEQDFRDRFDVMALQRNLKALGTFGFQTTARRNPVYMQYIPRTLHYARRTLAAHARFGRLQELLAELVDELA
jgi:aminoglycoside/choline kinase family phosphotransferase